MLNSMQKEDDEKWIIFNLYDDPVEANIAKGVLETNDIPCVIMNEIMSSVLPISPSPVGQIKLMIPERYLKEATSLIKNQAE